MLGRPAALDGDQAANVVEAYAKGAAVKALARQYHVAPKTIRRVLDTAGARDVGDLLKEPARRAELLRYPLLTSKPPNPLPQQVGNVSLSA
jgi:transposase-like protein